MGLSVPAAHVVVFIALASAGTLFAGTLSDTLRDTTQAQDESFDRQTAIANERFSLGSDGYAEATDRVFANFTNDGGQEVSLSDVNVLVNGTLVDKEELTRFEVLENNASLLWMPGETLTIAADNHGDASVVLVGPHGVRAYRNP